MRKTTQKAIILTSAAARIEGYSITAYKGIAQGETWNELLRHAEEIGANAVLNTCFDDALDADELFQSTAVVMKHECLPRGRQPRSKHPNISRRARSRR